MEMSMFEYAISIGKGTLVDYGICPTLELMKECVEAVQSSNFLGIKLTVIFAPITFEDCQTGK